MEEGGGQEQMGEEGRQREIALRDRQGGVPSWHLPAARRQVPQGQGCTSVGVALPQETGTLRQLNCIPYHAYFILCRTVSSI